MDVASGPSYVHGASPVPLLGETIGQNLDRTAARVPDNDALVSVHQGVRMTYAELHAAVEEVARGLLALGVEPGARVGIWSPNNAEWVTLQYATAKVGAILVNVNPAYRTSELAYALGQSGVSTLVLAPRFRQADYLDMLDQVAGDLPALERRVVLGPDTPAGAMGWDELRAGAGRVPVERLREREALLQFDDPINIQYTSGTTGFPKGATLSHHNILNNALLHRRGLRLHRGRPGLHPGAALPLLRHGPRQPGLHHPGRGDGLPGRGVRARRPTLAAVQAERCTSLYGVPTMFIAELEHPRFADFDLTSLRTGIMAGSPCPVEVMKKVAGRHAHGRGHHLLRHDRDLARCRSRPAPTTRSTSGSPPSARVHPHVEVKVDRSRQRARSSPGDAGRALHPRLPRHARLLGRTPRPPREAIDAGRLDAHRRPGRHGRRRLRQHRRPHQGHGHPRRREHLSARGRGVPLPAPGRRRRPGHRRARRPLRRGADGLGAAARGHGGHRRRAARLVPGPDRLASRSPATGSSSTRSP